MLNLQSIKKNETNYKSVCLSHYYLFLEWEWKLIGIYISLVLLIKLTNLGYGII